MEALVMALLNGLSSEHLFIRSNDVRQEAHLKDLNKIIGLLQSDQHIFISQELAKEETKRSQTEVKLTMFWTVERAIPSDNAILFKLTLSFRVIRFLNITRVLRVFADRGLPDVCVSSTFPLILS
uniref:Uncharacterized protein n=1 Tax=Caenorhabditis japonica TaxID=281687 RepID=A0A8R1EX93_CAEJA